MIIFLYHQTAREFRAKMWAAHQFALQFGAAAVAQTSHLDRILHALPGRHAVVEMALTSQRAERFVKLRSEGHATLSFDEEATAQIEQTAVRREALGPLGPDLVLLLGEQHKTQLKPFLHQAGQRAAIVGSPRLDVMRPEFATYFRSEFQSRDPFSLHVLITRNIVPGDERRAYESRIENFVRKQERADALRRTVGAPPSDPYRLPSWTEFLEEQCNRLEDLRIQLDIARTLRDEIGLHPILRPRLEVEPRVLRKQLSAAGFTPRDRATMRIVRRASLSSLIHSAECVVSFGCTSAIDSLIANKQVLHLDAPHRDFSRQSEVTREIGKRVSDGASAVAALAEGHSDDGYGMMRLEKALQVQKLSTQCLLTALSRSDLTAPVWNTTQHSREQRMHPGRIAVQRLVDRHRSANHHPAPPQEAVAALNWLNKFSNSDVSIAFPTPESFVLTNS